MGVVAPRHLPIERAVSVTTAVFPLFPRAKRSGQFDPWVRCRTRVRRTSAAHLRLRDVREGTRRSSARVDAPHGRSIPTFTHVHAAKKDRTLRGKPGALPCVGGTRATPTSVSATGTRTSRRARVDARFHECGLRALVGTREARMPVRDRRQAPRCARSWRSKCARRVDSSCYVRTSSVRGHHRAWARARELERGKCRKTPRGVAKARASSSTTHPFPLRKTRHDPRIPP